MVLKHQDGLVGPDARALERGVGGERHKYVVEHVGVGHGRVFAVAHVHARIQEHPVAVVGGRHHPTIIVVPRRVRVRRCRRVGGRTEKECRGYGGESGEQARREARILRLLGDAVVAKRRR
jgi:hypothetical protein